MMGNIDIILICHFKNTLYFRQLVSLHSLGFMHLYIYKSNQLDITKILIIRSHGLEFVSTIYTIRSLGLQVAI